MSESIKVTTTEFCSSVKDENGNVWAIIVKKVEWPTCTFYKIKEKSLDGRSRSEIQVDEAEAKVLLAVLKEALGVKS